MLSKVGEKYGSELYALMCVLVGCMFFMHGLKKFGLLGGTQVELASLMGVAGLVEIVVGLGLVLGCFSRLMAFLGGGQMLVAYVMFHGGNGWNPLDNGGELALMYFAVFISVLRYGNHKWGFEKKLLGKERF